MKAILLSLVTLLVGFGTLTGISAAQDVQVPLDESGSLVVVDADIAARAGLFPEYPGFQEARLFHTGDGAYALLVRYDRDGEVVQVRLDLTEAEVAELRAGISDRLYADAATPRLDQAGRVRLLRTAALMSLVAYGPSLSAVLGINDGPTAGTITLASGGLGFFVPYYATRNLAVTRAAASLTTNAGVLGYLHGVAAAALVGGDGVSAEAVAGAGLAFSLGEAVLAYRLATNSAMTEGSAAMMLSGGLFGGGIGLATAALALGDAGVDGEESARVFAGSGLLGSIIGAYAGYGLSTLDAYTRGDARVLSTAGVLGVYAGASIARLASVDDVRGGALLGIAGTGAGLVAGRMFTRGRDFSYSQGNYVALGSLAGGLIGSAVATALEADDVGTMTLGTLGGAAGFALMYSSFAGDAAGAAGNSFELSVLPGSTFTGPMRTHSKAPVLHIRTTF